MIMVSVQQSVVYNLFFPTATAAIRISMATTTVPTFQICISKMLALLSLSKHESKNVRI